MSDSWDSSPSQEPAQGQSQPGSQPGPQQSSQPGSLPHAAAPGTYPNPAIWIAVSIGQIIFCCNPLFGIPALILSIQAKTKLDRMDVAGAKSKLKGSKILLAIGVIVSLIALIAFTVTAAVRTGDFLWSSTGGLQQRLSGENPSKTVNVNETATDGSFEFVAKSISCDRTTLGTEPFATSAQGRFCLVAFTVKNVGSTQQIFDVNSQKLRGNNSVTYGSDLLASTYANPNSGYFSSDSAAGINPGSTIEGVVAFDVPQDVQPTSVILRETFFSPGVEFKF